MYAENDLKIRIYRFSILLMNLFPPCVFSVFAYLLDIDL